MNSSGSRHKKIRRGFAVASGMAFLLIAVLLQPGCGDSSENPATTQSRAGKISRPAPGTVEILDGMNDIRAAEGMTAAPSWLDINWVSIAGEDADLTFSMEVAGKLPETLEPGLLASEMGFLLD